MKRLLCILFVMPLVISAFGASAEGPLTRKQGQYVDAFDDPTGEEFTYIDIEGTFSNTATDRSELSVRMIVDFNNIEFHLLEYGKFEVTNLFDTPSYTILWSRFTKIEGKFFSTSSFIGIMTRGYCRKSRMRWGTESVVKGGLSLYRGRSFSSTKIGAMLQISS